MPGNDHRTLTLQSLSLGKLHRKIDFFRKMGWSRDGGIFSEDPFFYQKITQVTGFEVSMPYLKEQTCSKCFHEFSAKYTMDPCPICQVTSTPVTLDNGKVVTFDNETVDLSTDKELPPEVIKFDNRIKFSPVGWVLFLLGYSIASIFLGYFIGTGQLSFFK